MQGFQIDCTCDDYFCTRWIRVKKDVKKIARCRTKNKGRIARPLQRSILNDAIKKLWGGKHGRSFAKRHCK